MHTTKWIKFQMFWFSWDILVLPKLQRCEWNEFETRASNSIHFIQKSNLNSTSNDKTMYKYDKSNEKTKLDLIAPQSFHEFINLWFCIIIMKISKSRMLQKNFQFQIDEKDFFSVRCEKKMSFVLRRFQNSIIWNLNNQQIKHV